MFGISLVVSVECDCCYVGVHVLVASASVRFAKWPMVLLVLESGYAKLLGESHHIRIPNLGHGLAFTELMCLRYVYRAHWSIIVVGLERHTVLAVLDFLHCSLWHIVFLVGVCCCLIGLSVAANF